MPVTNPEGKIVVVEGSRIFRFDVNGNFLAPVGVRADVAADLGIGGMTSFIKLDEGTGNSAKDSVSPIKTGQITGGHWVAGKFGYGLVFLGDDKVAFADDDRWSSHAGGPASGAMAISFWAKRIAGISSYVMSKGATPDQLEWNVSSSDGQELVFALYNSTSTQADSLATTTGFLPIDGFFHNIVFSFDKSVVGEKAAAYVDGIKRNSSSSFANAFTSINGTASFLIGNGGGFNSAAFANQVILDQIRFFNKKLTDGGVGVGTLASVGSDVYKLATE